MNYMPPNPPWERLKPVKDAGGYLSIFYSDDMSRLPVRSVTKPGDNKSDPNLETMTYGMFSTCSRVMRAGIVKRGAEYMFFATRRGNERVLVGYYHVKWIANWAHAKDDFCVAADKWRFVATPIPLSTVDRFCTSDFSNWFRTIRVVTEAQTKRMVGLLDALPDVTNQYLDEIDRLERFNLRYGGYRYVGWKQKKWSRKSEQRYKWKLWV